jgi:hypothetical protein
LLLSIDNWLLDSTAADDKWPILSASTVINRSSNVCSLEF